jgi:hypothetical protein
MDSVEAYIEVWDRKIKKYTIKILPSDGSANIKL